MTRPSDEERAARYEQYRLELIVADRDRCKALLDAAETRLGVALEQAARGDLVTGYCKDQAG